MSFDATLGEEDYCYLTTTGRVTGSPHTIEIWFGLEGDTLYMLSGGGRSSDWARKLLFDKYQGRYSGDLSRWRETALPVAVEFGVSPEEE